MSFIRFSVVIPTLNEEEAIGRCIDAVRTIDSGVEIIVADGGSSDRTAAIAEDRGAIVCQSVKGRGRQMNAGAAAAGGEVLLFLHADTILPNGAFERLGKIFSDGRANIGVFGLTFDRKHWLLGLGLLERLTAFGMKFFRFGDSCITVRKGFFTTLGGFPQQSLFEDLELLRRASRKTRIHRFPMKVTTSARRFTGNGVVRQLLQNVVYMARYLLGADPEKLAEEYERGNGRLNRRSLLMMVRYPEPGKVKSRLAAAVGDKAAAEIYSRCAETLFAAAGDLPDAIDKRFYCADTGDMERIAGWAGGKFQPEAQTGGGLGQRLDNGFVQAFGRGAGKIVITASDVPGISSAILDQAFRALDRHDAVIGPSPDGGYYLIGLRKRAPRLFRNLAWSTGAVLEQTLLAAEKSDLSVHLLPPLQDIDTAQDWSRWLATRGGEPTPIEVEYAAV